MKKTAAMFGLFLISACEVSWIGSGSEGKHPLKRSFVRAAEQNHVPVQLLLATAWLESRMTASATGVVYDNDMRLGIQSTETAFGVPRHKLAPFSKEEEDLAQLDAQVAAYARLVRAHLDDHSIQLNLNMQENKHVLAWVQELAKLQRTGDKHRNNTRSLFALEMLAVLNNGFEWRDPTSGEEILLPPHHQQLKRIHIPYPAQQFFNLRTTAAQLYQAHWLLPTNPQVRRDENKPQRILVIHCPFSLSACLELQNAKQAEGSVALQAHYIIPANAAVIDYPLQVAHHDRRMVVTAPDGQPEIQQNKIVIMLSGNSGRIVNNVRLAADPTWQNGFQLEWLGYMVRELCIAHLGLRSTSQMKSCGNPHHADTRVEFRLNRAGTQANHRWGEIADFDRNIYAAYLQQPQSLQTEFIWLDQRTNGKYHRGENIRLALPSNGRNWYVLEKLVRCPNNKLLYVPVAQSESNASRQQQFSVSFYDRGPNGDGTQFLRAKVFKQQKLQAWAVGSLKIADYDQEVDSIYYEGCDA